MKPFLTLLFLLSAQFSFTQTEITVNKRCLQYLDKTANKFVIIDDSNARFIYYKGQWNKKPYLFLSDTYTFDRFKEIFVPISIKNKGTFFVHYGGGVVYQLKNDTLQRIDNSFEHRSQYGFGIFAYNNKIHCFGGYGLFTNKNYTVYYDNQRKEWFKLIVRSDSIPHQRIAPLTHFQDNNFYIFGGQSDLSAENETIESRNIFYDVWKLNLKTKKWIKLGVIIDEVVKAMLNPTSATVPYPSGQIVASNANFFIFDIKNNSYKLYHNESYGTVKRIIYNRESRSFLIARFTQNANLHICTVEKEADFLKGEPKVVKGWYALEEETSNHYVFYTFLITLCIIGFFFLLWEARIKKKAVKNAPSQTESLSKDYFTALEKSILQLLLQTKDGILISDLNNYFDEENISYTTLKKRRETFMKKLKEKLALLNGLALEKTIKEEKSEKDRRIKIIALHPSLIPIVKANINK